MSISKDKVVTFHYRLSDESGKELESSHGQDPIAYLQGHGNIISGLEKAMLGKTEGDVFTTTVSPEEGYGLRRDDAIQRVPIKHLLGDKKKLAKLKKGDVASINTDHGPKQVTIVKAGKFNVDVDSNHPLAGKPLVFDVEVVSIREATAEEIAHGHAHGVGGHQH